MKLSTVKLSSIEYYSVGSNAKFCVYTFDGVIELQRYCLFLN